MTNVVDALVKDGIVFEADVSRNLAALAHMGWVDLSAKPVPPEVITLQNSAPMIVSGWLIGRCASGFS